LQSKRTFAASVAVGNYSTIVGGSGNQSAGAHSFAGGNDSSASGQYSFSYGNTNSSSGQASTVFGQSNNGSSNFSTVSGGQSNTASTNTHATVVGGQSNTASGQHSVAGGQGNTASGSKSFCFGNLNVSSGVGSFNYNGQPEGSTVSGAYGVNLSGGATTISGESGFSTGYNNNVSALGATAFGSYVKSYLRGQFATNNAFMFGSDRGSSQQSNLTSSKQSVLTTAATTVLSLDGTGVTNLIIPDGNNRLWNVVASWSAIVTAITGTATGVSVGDVATECNLLAFKRVGGTSSVVGTVTNVASHSDLSMASASMSYTAGASQEMALTFTGPTFLGGGSVTCRVVCKLMLTEVAY
jgi:hypothetical protein